MAFVECSDELWRSVEAIAQEEGLGLYDLEVQGQPKICVVVERVASESASSGEPVKPLTVAGQGVTSGDCTRLCRRLMVYFHAEGPNLGVGDQPPIDVSSPGVNRKLRLRKHFHDAVGEQVRVVLNQAVSVHDGAEPESGPFVGELLRVDDGEICLREAVGDREVIVSHAKIKRARVEFEFPF